MHLEEHLVGKKDTKRVRRSVGRDGIEEHDSLAVVWLAVPVKCCCDCLRELNLCSVATCVTVRADP